MMLISGCHPGTEFSIPGSGIAFLELGVQMGRYFDIPSRLISCTGCSRPYGR